MGRPPLGYKLINIRMPAEMLEKIDALVGTHRRPQFIRDAVENALKLADLVAKKPPPKS
jgi:hypothetical protein